MNTVTVKIPVPRVPAFVTAWFDRRRRTRQQRSADRYADMAMLALRLSGRIVGVAETLTARAVKLDELSAQALATADKAIVLSEALDARSSKPQDGLQQHAQAAPVGG